MIRPEDIAMTRAAPSRDANVLQGIVVAGSFLGNLIDYAVETEGVVLHVQVSRGVTFEHGDRVYLSVPPEQCIGIE
jgi:hypothetical protein